MGGWVSLNGQLVSAADACVAVSDAAFLWGVGLFETLRAYGGRPFRLGMHVDRMRRSAHLLGWQRIPASDTLVAATQQVLTASELADARLRLTVTPGVVRAGADEPDPPTIVATAAPLPAELASHAEHGVTVVWSVVRQNPHDPTVGHKTTSYLPRLVAQHTARARGAFEALWLTPGGHVAEGAVSNVFAVRDRQLLTPPLETPVLPGVTRALVLELAAGLGIGAAEQALTANEILAADEVFLTNSLIEVMPVARIEDVTIGAGRPGPVTGALALAYRELVTRECGRSA